MSEAQATLLRRAKLTLRVCVFVIFALIAALVAIENTGPVRLRLLGYETAEAGIFWWLLTLFVVGLTLGRVSRLVPRK